MSTPEAVPPPPAPPAPPATAEMPPPDPAIVPLDPEQDAFTQVLWHATSQGRDNVEGLTYEANGIRYVAESDIVHHHSLPQKKMRRILPSFSRQPGGAHTFEYTPEETEFITVKGYDQFGELVSRVQYDGVNHTFDANGNAVTEVSVENSGFARHLNHVVRESVARNGSPPVFRLDEVEPSPETGTRIIPVDLSDPDKPILDAVLETVENEGLHDGLAGLTWTRDGYIRHIVEDSSRSWSTREGQRTLRDFVLEVAHPDGRTISRSVLNSDQLRKQLQVANTPPNPPLTDLRFEVPDPEAPVPPSDPLERWYWEEERAWLGWFAVRPPSPEEETIIPIGERLSVDTAADMLSYGDILGKGSPEEIHRADYLKSSIEGRKYIKALQDMVAEVGSDELWNVADSMLTQYDATLAKLGLPLRPDDKSLSWVFEELARRRHLAENPDEINAEHWDKGAEIHNPIGKRASARLTRRDIVDMRVGDYIATPGVGRTHNRVPVRGPARPGHEEEDSYLDVIGVNERFTSLLQPSIRDEIVTLLKRTETGYARHVGYQLTAGDLAHMGRLVGRSVNERLLE